MLMIDELNMSPSISPQRTILHKKGIMQLQCGENQRRVQGRDCTQDLLPLHTRAESDTMCGCGVRADHEHVWGA